MSAPAADPPLATARLHCDGEPPRSLLDAVAGYERALMADDLDAMDALFAPAEQTLRADQGGLLVGHRQIHDFRAVRGGAPARTVVDLHVQLLGPEAAVVVAVTSVPGAAHGTQTQVWRRGNSGPARPGGWQIVAAHVTPPATSFDRRVWRVVGDPLHVSGAAVVDPATGPLAGETVAVKDVFAVAGHRLGGGVPDYLAEATVQTSSATSLTRLLDAGARVRGIARTDQFAYSLAGDNPHYGTPPNPVVAGALPGGSSSGSATAVRLGIASIGLATDTAGSVRVPASYQGLWGLRTTHALVPVDGLLPLAPDFDTVGLLTRDADVLLRATRALTDGVADAGTTSRLLVAPWAGLQPAVHDACAQWLAPLSTRPSRLERLDEAAESFRVWQAWQAWQVHGAWIAAHPGAVTGSAGQRFAAASTVTRDQARAAVEVLEQVRAEWDSALGEDVLVLPSTPSPAPRVWAGEADLEQLRTATLRLTCVAGVTGRPAVSAPLLQTPGGPVGVCLVGPRGSDLALVELARSLGTS